MTLRLLKPKCTGTAHLTREDHAPRLISANRTKVTSSHTKIPKHTYIRDTTTTTQTASAYSHVHRPSRQKEEVHRSRTTKKVPVYLTSLTRFHEVPRSVRHGALLPLTTCACITQLVTPLPLQGHATQETLFSFLRAKYRIAEFVCVWVRRQRRERRERLGASPSSTVADSRSTCAAPVRVTCTCERAGDQLHFGLHMHCMYHISGLHGPAAACSR